MPMLTVPRPAYRHLHDDVYMLTESLSYRDINTKKVWKVPVGFKWDKGTVLKFIPRALVPHGDEMTYPSAVHDMFYTNFAVTKRVADRILRQFLIEEGLARWKAWAAWSAVRLNLRAQYYWGE